MSWAIYFVQWFICLLTDLNFQISIDDITNLCWGRWLGRYMRPFAVRGREKRPGHSTISPSSKAGKPRSNRGGWYFFDLADFLFEDIVHCFNYNSSSRVRSLVTSQSEVTKISVLSGDIIIVLVSSKNMQVIRETTMPWTVDMALTNHSFPASSKSSVHVVKKTPRKRKNISGLMLYGSTLWRARQFLQLSSNLWRYGMHERLPQYSTVFRKSFHCIYLATPSNLRCRSSQWLVNRALGRSTAVKMNCMFADS